MGFEKRLMGHLLYATALTSTLFLAAAPAFAQEDSARGATLEVIIVTSERREGNLQNVPVAVSAFSTETIERADISHPIDIANRVPSFTFSPFAPGQAVFSLRGISSNDDGAGTENSVAVFLDDVYFGRISNSAFDFFDVERVEVLRGPQGTLYGKNAIGGALNIVSKKPSTEDFDAKLRVTLGNFNTRNIGGYASGPIAGNFAAKVSFALRKHDGYVTNILTGNDLADQDSLSVRGQLLWQTENTEVMLTGWTQDEDNSDMGRIPLPTAGVRPFFDAAGGDVERRLTVTPQEGFSIRNADGVSLKIDHDLGSRGAITSVTAYYETSANWEMDSAGVFEVNVVDEIIDGTDVFTQELRWAGNITDDIDLVVGGFYLNEQTDRREFFHFVSFTPLGLPILTGVDDRLTNRPADDPDDAVGGYRQVNETNSFAAFAHANWQITERFGIGAGLRFTYDKKNIASSGAVISGVDPTSGLPGFIINETFGDVTTGAGIELSDSWSDLSPKISLNWQVTDDVLVYLSYAKGFKSGGFGASPSTAADAETISLSPETANNIELGLKGDFLGNTLRANLAGFYTKYKNLQLQRFGPSLLIDPDSPLGFSPDPTSFGFFRTINAGDADIFGFEAELTWVPVEGLTLTAAYSFLDTDAELNFRQFFRTDPGVDVIVNRPLNRAPEHKVALGATYEHDLGNTAGRLRWGVEYRYTDGQRGDFVDDDTFQDAFELVDASLAWISPNEAWEVSVWGKNLTDDRYFSHVYIIGPGQIGVIGAPRTYGVTVFWRY